MSETASGSDALQLELRSDTDVLPGVREKLRTWTARHGWTEDQAGEITLAVDEALTNVIRHAYDSVGSHKILLTAETIREPELGEGVEIRVRDFGKQVDPEKICGRKLEEVRPGGLGVHLMRAMMSCVEYKLANGGGMLLVMRKYKCHVASGQGPLGKTT